jgi:transposase
MVIQLSVYRLQLRSLLDRVIEKSTSVQREDMKEVKGRKKAKSCSLDLKEKMMAHIKEGKKKMEAARVFKLNRKMIYRWEKRQEDERLAITRCKVYKSQQLDPDALREYVKLHLDKTLKEIGQAFGASDVSVFYRIRQLRITYKKSYYTRSGTKKNGEHSRNSSIKSK